MQESSPKVLDEFIPRPRFYIFIDLVDKTLLCLPLYYKFMHKKYEKDLLLSKTFDMCTTEKEIFRCLDCFLTHHQIYCQKYKLAVWTV